MQNVIVFCFLCSKDQIIAFDPILSINTTKKKVFLFFNLFFESLIYSLYNISLSFFFIEHTRKV